MLKTYFLKKEDNFKETIFSSSMANKYKNEEKRIMSSFAWASLEKIFKKEYNLALSSEDIIFNKYHKPYLKDKNIYFSLSHYDKYVAIAISSSDVGIDVEGKISKEKSDKLIKRMSDKIKEEYNNEVDKEDYFTAFWVRNESYIKREGIGIDTSMIDVEIDEEVCANEFVFIDEDKEIYLCAMNAMNDILDFVKKEI